MGNPIRLEARLLAARRCGAYARTTGASCRGPAMKNGRCRMPELNVGGRVRAAVATPPGWLRCRLEPKSSVASAR